jgi:hypothetical protein
MVVRAVELGSRTRCRVAAVDVPLGRSGRRCPSPRCALSAGLVQVLVTGTVRCRCGLRHGECRPVPSPATRGRRWATSIRALALDGRVLRVRCLLRVGNHSPWCWPVRPRANAFRAAQAGPAGGCSGTSQEANGDNSHAEPGSGPRAPRRERCSAARAPRDVPAVASDTEWQSRQCPHSTANGDYGRWCHATRRLSAEPAAHHGGRKPPHHPAPCHTYLADFGCKLASAPVAEL